MGVRPAAFLLALLPALCLVCNVVAETGRPPPAKNYDYGFDAAHIIRKRHDPQQPFVVRGAKWANGSSVPLRPDIRKLEKDADKWTLFLLGLDMMEFADQNDPLSWYQIAGIHGVPFVPWSGVKPTPGNEQTGYCTHESILFPTWHRPYLALYEQIIYDHIQLIASWYADDATRKRYQDAAADFRIPYWDWAARPPEGQSLMPSSVGGSPSVEVAGPNGNQTISNPLFMYAFNPLNASAFYLAPWNYWGNTLRSPSSTGRDATSNNTNVALALDQNQASIQQRIYHLYANYHNYTAFSNEAWYPKTEQGKYDSVESVHDTVHSLGGMGGHMTFIPFSSFDPLFWLHHANLDRIFAIWQTIYPNSWITPQPARMASFTTSAGEGVNAQTPLTPFYADAQGTFWNSDMVRNPEVFGYNYADTAGSTFGVPRLATDDRGIRRRVRATVNRLYGDSSPARLGYAVPHQKKRTGSTEDGAKARANAWWSSTSPDPAPGTVLKGQDYREWVATIHAQKQALDSTYFIHLFSGEPPADPERWATAQNLIGTLSVFAHPRTPALHHMMAGGGGNIVSGTIPLTSYLTSRVVASDLSSLEVHDVEPYLRRSLHLRVILADNTVVDPASVQDLRVGIISSVVTAPSSEFEFPKWGETMSHFDLV